jgi:hypothetical protein
VRAEEQTPFVLLVGADMDALTDLARALRGEGIRVSLATGRAAATERAKSGGYHVILATRSVVEPDETGLGLLDTLALELSEPPPYIVLAEHEADLGASAVATADVGELLRRIGEVVSRGPSSMRPDTYAPSTFGLGETRLADLLATFSEEGRTGTFTIVTAHGSGEIRMHEGDVVDAVYVRVEGLKALARLASERQGRATFYPSKDRVVRRMREPTPALVAFIVEHGHEMERLTDALGGMGKDTLLSTTGGTAPNDPSHVVRLVASKLRVPATLEELLDSVPAPDAAVLAALVEIDHAGRLRRMGKVDGRVHLGAATELPLLRANAARARAPGFAGPGRIIMAATPSRLSVLAHTIPSLADAIGAKDGQSQVPVPHLIATLRLGDSVDIDIVALPLVPAYSPLWPLALAGASVLVRLDAAASRPLEDVCATHLIPILEAQRVVPGLDESNAMHVARLLRAAIEATAFDG